MRKHSSGTVALAMVVGLGVAGCGDGGGDPLTKAAFVERGSQICTETNQRIEERAASAFREPGKIPTAEEIEKFASETVVPQIESELDRLEELEPPEDDVDRIDDIIEEGRNGVDDVREDPTILLSSADDGLSEYRELASGYGLENCGGGSEATRDAISGIVRENA